jgi:pyruvate dehydrogenase E2 component (dihydrolipoamide acetyltransferase)
MATEIIVPKVDMVMETGTFVEWLKQEGDSVQKGEAIFVILTDKSAIECESPASGILAGVNAKPDDVLPVTTIIGYILKPGETLPTNTTLPEQTSLKVSEAPLVQKQEAVVNATPLAGNDQVLATPIARKMAKEMGINLKNITGKGPLGRIYQVDVEAYAQIMQANSAVAKPVHSQPQIDIPLPNLKLRERISLKGPRAIIAQRLSYSSSTIPHIYQTVSIDMTEMIRLHGHMAPIIKEKSGLKLTYTAILVYVVAHLLKQHPYMNSSFSNNEIFVWEDVHIGVATNLDDYLIVPVVHEAQKKDLRLIVEEMAHLLEKARAKKLEPADMSGSTFTISNLGMYGIEDFTAIINPPESAILAVGKITETPVTIHNQIVSRPIMKVTIAADHRVNDGVRVARFLTDLKSAVENPYYLL